MGSEFLRLASVVASALPFAAFGRSLGTFVGALADAAQRVSGFSRAQGSSAAEPGCRPADLFASRGFVA